MILPEDVGLLEVEYGEKNVPRSTVKDNRDLNGKQLGKANISVIKQDKLSIQRTERISKTNRVSETCRTPLNI